MAGHTLVIVESPAKAKKIQSFLGSGYQVLASFGHVRDLPGKAAEVPKAVKGEPWANLGVNTEKDFEPLYIVSADKKKRVTELKEAMKGAKELLIATDEDREGESIGWHLIQLLKPKVPVKRMVFSEITKDAIQKAVGQTRALDTDLVEAQETRRILDRLYGYTLSPLLWKKISSGLSAGRVQSVAVRMLTEREMERLAFRSSEYWDLAARLSKAGDEISIESTLTEAAGKSVASGRDFDESTGRLKPTADVTHLDETEATRIADVLKRGASWSVKSVEERQSTRKPYPPFTTSTLQQEANRKLGMTARRTMQTAQRLYEDGHITYMRTDSVNLSGEATTAARDTVKKRYGDKFLSPSPRKFKGKSKGAQEAHEAIRPAGTKMKTAKELGLAGAEGKLYDLIWKRTVACQMAEARFTFQTVLIDAAPTGGDKATPLTFRATGKRIDFPGFLRAYVEGSDDPAEALDDQDSLLPALMEGDVLALIGTEGPNPEAVKHETKPPARYTEASLVKRLEAEGIGRPSTYASILSTIQDRGYAEKQGNQLVPTFTALAVNRLLERNFPNLVDYQFTAQMENQLDEIADGKGQRLPYLERFYKGEEGLDRQVKSKEESIDPRDACTLRLDNVTPDVRVGRYGPYFEAELDGQKFTASLPADVAPADLNDELAEKLIEEKRRGPQSLGVHPEEGLEMYVKSGPYGPYVQLGEATDERPKPKRSSIPKFLDPEKITAEEAAALLALPRRLGHHSEDGLVVKVGVGPYGPYVLHNKKYGNFDKKTHTFEHEGKSYNVFNVTLPVAEAMLKQSKKRAAPDPLKDLGEHPKDGKPVQIFEGKYGPYVKHGKINATLPKDADPKNVSMDEAVRLIAEKEAKGGGKRGGRKKAAKKTTAKKKAAPKRKKAAAK
ncbi:type I DNA topoisomerase [Alienimonas sp. DA493]|uniref:type I DNA topoisomerase n=1 Tax=Alienimonas sp. DA493 TaxID=3373605 RepID=UPI0037550E83